MAREREIRFVLGIKTGNSQKQIAKLVGTAADLRAELEKIRKTSGKGFTLTKADVDALVKSAERADKKLGDYSGTIRLLQNRYGNLRSVSAKTSRSFRQTGDSISRTMASIMNSAKVRVMHSYNMKIAALSLKLKQAGVSALNANKYLQPMRDTLAKISVVNMDKAAAGMHKYGRSIKEVREIANNYVRSASGKLAGQTGIVGGDIAEELRVQRLRAKANSAYQRTMRSQFRERAKVLKQRRDMIRNTVRQGALELGGALGFTAIDIGTKMQQMALQSRTSGSARAAVGSIASTVGSIFGDTVSAVAGDLGRAAGTIAEMFFNFLTFSLRKLAVSVGGAIRGIGYTLASGLIGGIIGTLAGGPGGGTAIGAAVMAGITLVVMGVISTIQVIAGRIQLIFEEVIDIVTKSMKVIGDVLTAGFRIIGAIVKGSVRVIKEIWSSFWKGLAALTRMSMNNILESIAKFANDSLVLFVSFERGAVKAAQEVIDIYGTKFQWVMTAVQKMMYRTGMSFEAINEAMFNTLSSGFRTQKEALDVLRASVQLAMGDMSDLGEATNSLVTFFNAYKSQLKDAAEAGRILNAGTTLGVTTLQEYGPALSSAASILESLGVPAREAAIQLAYLTRAFGRGSAGTSSKYMQRFAEAVYRPSSKARKEMEALGLDMNKIQDVTKKRGFGEGFAQMIQQLGKIPVEKLSKVFGLVQARRAFGIFSKKGAIEEIAQMRQEFEKLEKSVSAQVGMALNTMQSKLARINETINVAKLSFAKLLDKLLSATVFSNKMMSYWKELGKILTSSRIESIIERFGKALVVLRPVVDFMKASFEKFLEAVKSLVHGTMFDPQVIEKIKSKLMDIYKFFTSMMKMGDTNYIIMFARIVSDALLKILTIGEKIKNVFVGIFRGDMYSVDKLKRFGQEIYSMIVFAINKALTYASLGLIWLLSQIGVLIASFDIGALMKNSIFSGETVSAMKWLWETFLVAGTIALYKIYDIILQIFDWILNSDNKVITTIMDGVRSVYNGLKSIVTTAYALYGIFQLIWNILKYTSPAMFAFDTMLQAASLDIAKKFGLDVRFDKATPEVLKNLFANADQFFDPNTKNASDAVKRERARVADKIKENEKLLKDNAEIAAQAIENSIGQVTDTLKEYGEKILDYLSGQAGAARAAGAAGNKAQVLTDIHDYEKTRRQSIAEKAQRAARSGTYAGQTFTGGLPKTNWTASQITKASRTVYNRYMKEVAANAAEIQDAAARDAYVRSQVDKIEAAFGKVDYKERAIQGQGTWEGLIGEIQKQLNISPDPLTVRGGEATQKETAQAVETGMLNAMRRLREENRGAVAGKRGGVSVFDNAGTGDVWSVA
jgi:phage-related protein